MDNNLARPSQQSIDSGLERHIYIQRLEELNRRIHEAEKRLNEMYDQRQALEKQVKIGHALIAPINRLPAEILSEICDDVLYCDHFDDNQHPKNCRRGLLLPLMLVCKQWWSIIKAASPLWKKICLIMQNEHNCDAEWVERQYKYLQLCLSRSQGSLFELTMDFRFQIPAAKYIRKKMLRAFDDIAPPLVLEGFFFGIARHEPFGYVLLCNI